MKQMNKILSITLCGALLLANVPVRTDAAVKPFVTKKMTLVVGNSKTIKVKGSSIKKKTFKSNNRKVAVVNKKGKVTAKQRGVCKVTVKVKYKKGKKYVTKKYTCKVTVTLKYLVAPTAKPTEIPQITMPNASVIPSMAPVVSNEPIEGTKESSTPSVEVTPSPDVSSTPDITQEPEITPTVSNEPVKETKEPVTPSPTDSTDPGEKLDASSSPDTTQEPEITPTVSNEPVKETKEPVTPSPTDSTDPGEKPDASSTPDTTQEPEMTPTVTDEPTGETKEPSVPDETNQPVNTPSVKPEEPDIPEVTPPAEDEECEHVASDIWSIYVYENGKEDNWMLPLCEKCGNEMNSHYHIAFEYKGEQYTYTKWNVKPSETTEGILDVYQGVNIYDITQEELDQKYEKFNVVFSDGRTDTFYGKWINNIGEPTDNRDEAIHFGVYAKSTAEKIGSITYPKYEVKTIDLGNGETTKVYGYYDREMADEVFKLLNEYRVENGLNELGTNDYMQNISDIRSSEEFYTYLFDQNCEPGEEYACGQGHLRPDRSSFATVFKDIYTSTCRENLIDMTLVSEEQAGGIIQSLKMSAEYIMTLWKNSEEHNENMLAEDVNAVGVSIFVGYPQNKDGSFKSYKVAIPTQDFCY